MPSNKIKPDLSGTAFVVNVSARKKVMLSKDIYKNYGQRKKLFFLYHEPRKMFICTMTYLSA